MQNLTSLFTTTSELVFTSNKPLCLTGQRAFALKVIQSQRETEKERETKTDGQTDRQMHRGRQRARGRERGREGGRGVGAVTVIL